MARTSYWSIIIPEATTNLVTNPSFETNTTGWTTGGTNTIARDATEQRNGVYSLKCTYSNDDTLASYAITLTAAAHTISASVYIPSNYDGTDLQLQLQNFTSATISNGDIDMTLTDQWQLVEATITPDAGDLAGNIVLYENGTAPTATRFVYFDSVQAELKAYATTYCDGSLNGCLWSGAEHGSTSVRDALEPSGGKLNNLSDDLSFIVKEQDGTGMPPVNNLSSPLALQAGELFEDQTIARRHFTLKGSFVGTTPTDFHSKKQGLISALNPKTVKINERAKPRTFRYTGASVAKEIDAVYDGVLEGGLKPGWAEIETELKLRADDPMFYEVGNSGAALDTNDTDTVSIIVKRNSNGTWDALGNPSVADPPGGGVFAVAEDDTYLYVGGGFLNFDGTANSDYIARYDKAAGTWTNLGTAGDNIINSMAIAPNGYLYVCGTFTAIGGSSINRIAYWDGSSWNALGTGLSGPGLSLAFAPNGELYVCGNFVTAGGVTVNDIAMWDGSSWNALSTGLDSQGNALAVSSNNIVYVVGSFGTAGGVTVNEIAAWDGSAFTAVGDPGGTAGQSVAIDGAGIVYYGDTNVIKQWNGSSWRTLGSGISGGDALTIEVGIDGNIYVGGDFTTAGGITLEDSMAAWNGSSWSVVDINLPGTEKINDLYMNAFGDLYIGYGTTATGGTAAFAGSKTITYTGTESAYPIITISRSGGTSATLYSIRNVLTGASLLFDYSLRDGEKITIDTRPAKQSMQSSFSGNIYGQLFPNSDFGNFFLMPGNTTSQDNSIVVYVSEAGSPTVTATIEWRDTFISED